MSFVPSIRTALLGLTLCSFAAACGGDKPQDTKAEPVKKPVEPDPKPVEVKEDVAPPPVEEKIVVPDNCDIEVVGEKKVKRALVGPADGELVEQEVTEDGRTIRIVCPEDKEARKNLDVIAELEGEEGSKRESNIVHWRGVNVGEDGGNAAALELANAVAGIPEDRLEQVNAKLGIEPTPEAPAVEAVPKAHVTFHAAGLESANLEITDAKGKKRTMTLQPRDSRKLVPGDYTLRVQLLFASNSDEWKDAGSITIPEGKASVQVEFQKKAGKITATVK